MGRGSDNPPDDTRDYDSRDSDTRDYDSCDSDNNDCSSGDSDTRVIKRENVVIQTHKRLKRTLFIRTKHNHHAKFSG